MEKKDYESRNKVTRNNKNNISTYNVHELFSKLWLRSKMVEKLDMVFMEFMCVAKQLCTVKPVLTFHPS